jgi:hypothetical protein
MDAAAASRLARQIEVRQRTPECLRLHFPARLAAGRAAFVAALRDTPGVLRVDVEATPGGAAEFAIRCTPATCTHADLARAVKTALLQLPEGALREARPASHTPAGMRALPERLAMLWRGALSEQAALNFLNDILAFYLIKVHWDLITRRWLRQPLQHANAWLAVFYLIFLLIRFRKRISKKPEAPQ